MTTTEELDLTGKDEEHIRRLGAMAMPAHLEPVANKLFDLVCCGSQSMWPIDTARFKDDNDYRAEFYRLSHQGWWDAQAMFLDRIGTDEPLAPGEAALFRTAMDTVAWTMIQKQLCYARRLFKEKRQPSLEHSNLQSVVRAAKYMRAQQPHSMPLISDLTTFVQVGDLLVYDHTRNQLTIAEVKEGERNQDLARKVLFYKSSGCEQYKQFALQDEPARTAKQFERMARQMDRMQFVTEALSDRKTRDPDTSKVIHIREPFIPIAEWDDELNSVCDEAMEKGWAINMVDECVFLGAYARPHFPTSSAMFWMWMKSFAGGEQTPAVRLIDCISHPLSLPLPCLPLAPERIMDLMFGRLHVCMGISIPLLLKQCQKQGITVRPPSNRSERRVTTSWGQSAIRHEGQPVVLERGGKVIYPATGIFVRSLLHFQRPMAFINAIFEVGDWPEQVTGSGAP